MLKQFYSVYLIILAFRGGPAASYHLEATAREFALAFMNSTILNTILGFKESFFTSQHFTVKRYSKLANGKMLDRVRLNVVGGVLIELMEHHAEKNLFQVYVGWPLL